MDLEASVGPVLDRESSVLAAYVFGSRATADHRPESDLDLGVLISEEAPRGLDGVLARLARDLETELEVAVDLIDLHRAPADLVHRVLRDGHLLFERDRSARVRFEVRRRAEYYDLKPFLDHYRRVAAS